MHARGRPDPFRRKQQFQQRSSLDSTTTPHHRINTTRILHTLVRVVHARSHARTPHARIDLYIVEEQFINFNTTHASQQHRRTRCLLVSNQIHSSIDILSVILSSGFIIRRCETVPATYACILHIIRTQYAITIEYVDPTTTMTDLVWDSWDLYKSVASLIRVVRACVPEQ